METREMMDETIDLMARIRPGRMRWAIFFPFPGTRATAIPQKLGNLIDYRKMDAMDNYFCISCLKFDAPTDLYIKLQRTFHWRVNARAVCPSPADTLGWWTKWTGWMRSLGQMPARRF